MLLVGLIVNVYGQVENQRRELQAKAQSPELRTVIMSGDGFDENSWPIVDLVAQWSETDAVWAMSGAVDVGNAALGMPSRVSMREIDGTWNRMPIQLTIGRLPVADGEAIIDMESANVIQLGKEGGAVEDNQGRTTSIVGMYNPLHQRSPRGVLSQHAPTSRLAVRSVALTTESAKSIDLAANLVLGLRGMSGSGKLSVDKATEAARVSKGLTDSAVFSSSRILVVVGGISAVVLFLFSFFSAHLRSIEFGRRRALGARRSYIVSLVMVESFLTYGIGVGSGLLLGISCATIFFGGGVSIFFVVPVGAMVLAGATMLHVPSAIISSLKDPVKVLRSP